MGERTWEDSEQLMLFKDTGLKIVDEVANCMGDSGEWQAMSTEERQR